MTLQIELDAETEAQLTEQARGRGTDLETYAREILKASGPPPKEQKPRMTIEEYRAIREKLAKLGPDLSHLRDETFPRSMIYSDHD